MDSIQMKVRGAALCLLVCAGVFAADAKKVLVFHRCEGFVHRDSIALGNKTIAAQAGKMNYTVDFTEDYAALKPENLKNYDVVLLNNTTHMKTKQYDFVEQSLVDFVSNGGGFCLIHAALDNFYDAPKCAHMGGGQFDGHPWHAGGTWKFRVEDRTSPLTAPFKLNDDGTMTLGDEIYQHKSPFYDRSKLHILISLDLSDPATRDTKGQKRADKDYAVSWIRPYGRGRVFYTSFAHDTRAWNDPQRRAHIFAGLAYCLGDLKANDKPCCKSWDQLSATEKVTRLGQYAIDGDVKALAAHVDDAEGEIARAATLGLGRLGGGEALARLVQLAEKPGSDAALADARQTAFGAALAATAKTDLRLAATYAKTAYGLPSATEYLRSAAAKVLVAADPDFFPTAVADSSKQVVQAALSAAGTVPSKTLVKVLAEAKCPCLKTALLKRLAANKAVDAAAAVRNCLKDEDEAVAATAIETLASFRDADSVEAILAARARGGKVQAASDDALAEMGGVGEKVFKLAAEDPAMLNVAARRAESKLVDCWKPFLQADSAKTRKAAWRAFGKMVALETLDKAMVWFGEMKEDEADQASTAVWHVVKDADVATRDAALTGVWKKGNPVARKAAADLLFRSKSFGVFDFWTKLAEDPAFAAAAKQEYIACADRVLGESVSGSKLEKSRWKGSSSRDGGNVGRAFDGDANTRWTSGMGAKDVWYTLDLGGNFLVKEVTLDTTQSPGDTPAGCNVFVSFDGQTWKGPVATCDESTRQKTVFQFAAAARYLKFVARESRPNLHWSIHEIEVKAEADKAIMEKVRATADKYRAEAK